MNDRVSLKIKNSLRPEELTPATFMYEESITPIACFLDFGIERPIFWSPKTTIFTDFGNKNMGLRTPDSENGEHFLTHKNYPPNWWFRHLFQVNITFGRVLGQFLKSSKSNCRIFWPISLMKSQNRQPMVLLLKLKNQKSSKGCLELLTQGGFFNSSALKRGQTLRNIRHFFYGIYYVI